MAENDYAYRYISAYHLAEADLQKCLDEFFSPDEETEYFIELTAADQYKFWIPRKLTKIEENRIIAKRKTAEPR